VAIVLVHGPRGAGKTGVAAAIARHLAYSGSAVRLLRCSADPDDRARADARWFAACDFAPGSPSEPVASPTGIAVGTWVVAECDQVPTDELADAIRVLVVRGEPPSADAASGQAALVVTAVPAYRLSSLPSDVGGVPLIAIPEDRTLAGFAIDELQRHLALRVLVEGELHPDATCDELVIAPIGSDAGQPYLRRFAAPAVVARFDRTDMHLAALAADPVCLILTGGRMPSGYTLDAAQAKGVPVLLAPTDTESTIHLLEDVYGDTRFRGERKLERMSALLAAAGLFERLPFPQAVG
jgi:hypothetical protein